MNKSHLPIYAMYAFYYRQSFNYLTKQLDMFVVHVY